MTTRTLYPCRDTMRMAVGISAAKLIGALILTGAFFIGPDLIVSLVGAP